MAPRVILVYKMQVELEFKITFDGSPFLFTMKIEDSQTPQMKEVVEEARRQLTHQVKEKIEEIFT